MCTIIEPLIETIFKDKLKRCHVDIVNIISAEKIITPEKYT